MKCGITKRLIVLASLCTPAGVVSRELRTPLSLQRGHFHTAFEVQEDRIWPNWGINIWGGGYHKTAFDAFSNCHGTCTVPLANLFFCASEFTVNQAFPDSTLVVPGNPFVNFARISVKKLTYNEDGIVVGGEVKYHFTNERVHGGLRVALPVRRIEIRNDNLGPHGVEEEVIANVGARRNEILNDLTYNDVYAYRLDFLSSLIMTTGDPLVNYKDPLNANRFSIGQLDATSNNNSPVHVIQRDAGTLPINEQWIALNSEAVPALSGAGAGPGNNNRARFSGSIDYSALGADTSTQRRYFVVPTVADPQTSDDFTTAGSAIRTQIGNALRNVTAQSALDILIENGVSFDTQHTVGIGDLDTELYLGYDFNEQCYGEASFGVRWPTGERFCCPKQLFLLTRGNNGHYELRGGLTGLWVPRTWFNAKAFISYSRALERRECIAAPFAGATIKGIGPTVLADISWGYFWGTLDLTFMNPYCEDAGFDIGYEAYVKQHDNVDFCCGQTATDFVGQVAPLSACLAECDTRVVSHKIRCELFYHWDCAGIFAGFAQVVAGQNAMRESEWHLGLELRY